MTAAIKNPRIGAKCPKGPAFTCHFRMAGISRNKPCGSAVLQAQKIGPLLYVQTHYAQRVSLRFASRRDAKRFFPTTTLTLNSLEVIEGTLVYDDKCYGDWDVCYITAEFCKSSPRKCL